MASDFSIVLDIDETLVSMVEESDMEDYKSMYKSSGCSHRGRCFSIFMKEENPTSGEISTVEVKLIKRKGVDAFLEWAFRFFKNVYVWSAGIHPYVLAIEEYIFTRNGHFPKLTFSRNDCTDRENNMNKPLWKIIAKSNQRIAKDSLFILEDRYSAVIPEDRGNIVLISKFNPNWRKRTGFDDDELTKIRVWFESVRAKSIKSISSLKLKNGKIDGPIYNDEEKVVESEDNKHVPRQHSGWLYNLIYS